MTRPLPPLDAPIAHWSGAIREEVIANSGLTYSSAIRAAAVRHSLFTHLALRGIRHWPDLALDAVLDWASEPRRSRRGEEQGDRSPDDVRYRTASARHVVRAAGRLGAPVPLRAHGGELGEFLHPPERPERAPDDPAEIADAVARWRPQRWRHGSLGDLDTVLPQVRERVLAAGPASVHEARRSMQFLSGFTLWARYGRHSDPTAMHTPNNVETWVTRVNSDQDGDWQSRARGVLRRLGPTVNPAAWPRAPKPIPRPGVKAPYDARAEDQFRSAATLPRRDRRARIFVCVAAGGAGLSGPEIAAAESGDLVGRPDGRWEIRVRGSRPRRVPIRRGYDALAAELAAMGDESRFIASDKPGAVNQTAQRIRVGDEALSLTRARNTFLTAHIAAETPFAALRVIAGGVSSDTLDRLLEHVAERVDPADAVEQALGA